MEGEQGEGEPEEEEEGDGEEDEGEEGSDEEEEEHGYTDNVELAPKLVIKDESEYLLDKDYAKRVQETRAALGMKKWEVSDDEETRPESPAKKEAEDNGEGEAEMGPEGERGELGEEKEREKKERIKAALGRQFKKEGRVKFVRNQQKGKGTAKDY